MRAIDADKLCEDLLTRWSIADEKQEQAVREIMANVVTPIVVSQPTITADRPRGEWINIEEEPPIDSESVVVSVYFPDYGDTILAIGHYSPRFDQWRLYSDREGEIRSGHKVIAWMPLPEPYETKESE